MVNQKYDPNNILEYLKTHTYKQTMNDLGISEMQIARIKKKSENTKDHDSKVSNVSVVPELNSDLKTIMKTVFDEMWDSLSTKSQKLIMDKYSNEINQIMGVFI